MAVERDIGRWTGVQGVEPRSGRPRDNRTDTLLLTALQTGDREGEWRAQSLRLRRAWEACQPDDRHAALTRLLELSDDLDRPDLRAETFLQAAMLACADGRFDDMKLLHDGVRKTGFGGGEADITKQLLRAGYETGDLDPGAVSAAIESVPPSIRLVLHPWVALAGELTGRARHLAREFADEFDVRELPEDNGYHAALCMLAEVAALGEHAPLCADVYEALFQRADRGVFDGAVPRVWFGSTHLYLGMAATVVGDLSAGRCHLDRATYLHTLMGARCLTVRARLWNAQRARRANEHRAAAMLCESVTPAADALGMGPVAAVSRSAGSGTDEEHPSHRVRGSWQFCKDGTSWLITTGATQARIQERKGIGYLHRLIRRPGQELHVLDLVGAGTLPFDAGSGPVLDAAAKAEYRGRIEDLRDQIDEGEQWRDHERVDRARSELDAIAHEVSAAVGLGGRDRPSDVGERARVSVRKAIRGGMTTILDAVPEVGRHLERTVRTGYYCAYEPVGDSPPPWSL